MVITVVLTELTSLPQQLFYINYHWAHRKTKLVTSCILLESIQINLGNSSERSSLKSINPQGVVLECGNLVARCKKTWGIRILGLLALCDPPLNRPFTSEKSKPYSLPVSKKEKFDKALNSKLIKLAYSSPAYFFSTIFL